MIQEIFPHRIDKTFQPGLPFGDLDFVFYYRDNKLLLMTDGKSFAIPRKQNLPEITLQTECVFLFKLDENPCFLVFDTLEIAETPELVFVAISFFRTTAQQEIAWAGLVGYHLSMWYKENRFCGYCGAKTVRQLSQRALGCSACNRLVFPKISPAIIVAITCGNKILLARSDDYPGGWFSLIAGYADVGESLEETLVREVKEEVGLDVWNIRYYKSQPWPPSESMMVGFWAEAEEQQPIVVDGREIVEARWFKRGELPIHSLNLSIAGEMIEEFERGEFCAGK